MSTTVLKVILGWSILSTALHYAHNFVRIEDYPQSDAIPNWVVRVVIVVAWPLLTALAVVAYRRYARGLRRGATNAMLALYSLAGITSLGHFAIDEVDLPLFWMASIASDGVVGFAVLGFAVWSELTSAPAGADVARTT